MFELPHRRPGATRRRPLVMGILNVTPDSFSDGGEFLTPDSAVRQALRMIRDGADIVDLGAESTRPGSQPVAASEQIRRITPVVEGLRERHRDTILSIDTRLAAVAEAAIDAGAQIVNDVSALRDDSRLAPLVAERRVAVVLMHMRGRPADMQDRPRYGDVSGEILRFLRERAAFAQQTGIPAGRIILDPGIGFGKTTEHNLSIMRELERFVASGFSILLGASRKRFLGELCGEAADPKQRLGGSLACVVRAMAAGVHIVRVHDVRETCHVIDTLQALGYGR